MAPKLICPSPNPSRLLLLLPPGLCQVCPGLCLQRRLQQVQLLPLKGPRVLGAAGEASVQSQVEELR